MLKNTNKALWEDITTIVFSLRLEFIKDDEDFVKNIRLLFTKAANEGSSNILIDLLNQKPKHYIAAIEHLIALA